MKNLKLISIFFLLTISVFAKDECKQLKSCADYVTILTGSKYELGKFEKKSLKVDQNLKLTNGNAEQLFVYILEQNNFFRVATSDGKYRILDKKEFQSIQFPKVMNGQIQFTLDFFTFEYTIKNSPLKDMLISIAKKNISKNGRVLENAGDDVITLVDSGANLNKIVGLLNELDK